MEAPQWKHCVTWQCTHALKSHRSNDYVHPQAESGSHPTPPLPSPLLRLPPPSPPCSLQVGLMVMDEIHLLGQDRGPVLEVIVSRMRYIAAKTERPIRFLGLSTALANARWAGGVEG